MAIYELKMYGTWQGQEWNMIFHLADRADYEGVGDSQVLADFWTTELESEFQGAMVQNCLWPGVECREIYPEERDPVISATASAAGNIASTGLPSYCSVVMQQRTGFSSRRKRGRFYMPGVAINQVADGTITAAGLDDYNALAAELVGKFAAGSGSTNYVMGILSRTTMSEGATAAEAFTEVTNVQVNPTIGTQRRRRPGSGA